jgi:hypothetical protein
MHREQNHRKPHTDGRTDGQTDREARQIGRETEREVKRESDQDKAEKSVGGIPIKAYPCRQEEDKDDESVRDARSLREVSPDCPVVA